MLVALTLFFHLNSIGSSNFFVGVRSGNKRVHVGLIMKTSTKVRMPSLVSTMLTCQWEELNVLKRSVCSYFHLTWKLASHTMATKVS